VIEKEFYPAFQDITNPVRRVSLNALPYGNCGSTERKLGAGKTPGSGNRHGGGGGFFIKWLGAAELTKVAAKGGQR